MVQHLQIFYYISRDIKIFQYFFNISATTMKRKHITLASMFFFPYTTLTERCNVNPVLRPDSTHQLLLIYNNYYEKTQIKRICMESLEYNSANSVSHPQNCNKMLRFGK